MIEESKAGKKKENLMKRLLYFAVAVGLILLFVQSIFSTPDRVLAADITQFPEHVQIASIDFSNVMSLDNLPEKWSLSSGKGRTILEKEESGNTVLKMQRTEGGNETALTADGLGINEKDFRYVSVETKMKLGTEEHANQFSVPYLSDKSGKNAYTLLVEDSWDQYKSHVTDSSHKLNAGSVSLGQWQDVRMDIDMVTDTFRVAIDGNYELVGDNAREKVDNLDQLKFYADSWNTGTIYIQSVDVTAQKERKESADFYVSDNGDDEADGQSPESAWKTIERVNQEHFIPGDQILFERGGVWEDQTLQPQGSGTADAKIHIGSYGSGEFPRISTNGKRADGLYLCNQQYWEISELDISNTVEEFKFVTDGEIPTGNISERESTEGEKLGDYRGIHVAGRDVTDLKGFYLHDLKVHDVTGHVAWIGDTGLSDSGIVNNGGLDGSKRTGGVLFECLSPTGKQPTQFSDVLIEKSEFINNSFCGITFKQWHGSGDQYAKSPGWDCRSESGGAPDYVDDNWYPHSNITIQDNYINQGESPYACDGIYLTASRDSVIQRNVLEHIGTCGIELYFADNVAVQYNEVSDVVKKSGGGDDNAIDPDWRVTNALIQYNYIHDAGEGLLLCGVQFNSGIIRYNLLKDCTRSYIHYSMGSGYFEIYNNAFYRSADGDGTNEFDPWGGGTAAYFNNVFYDGKGTGFNFSEGNSFSYDNNAYYGTPATSKDKNPILLTEDPFEGSAPSMERKGSSETGVLLETNGLVPKADSPLIASGVTSDPNGISIDDGMKEKGIKFNFTPLAKADEDNLGHCIFFDRMSYPVFEKTGTDATFDTEKTQQAVEGTAPTIGLFEVPLDKDTVILRGKIIDGLNPAEGLKVEVTVGDNKIETETNGSGRYNINEGLKAGKASISVKQDGSEVVNDSVKLEGGKVNEYNITLPLSPMPETYKYKIVEESFEEQTSPENFGFSAGAGIRNGRLAITKDMNNAESAVKRFDTEVTAQEAVDFSFDWACEYADKMGFEFRDDYGRLLFAVCAAPQKDELRTSTTGESVDDEKAADKAEPTWSSVPLDTSKIYTFRVHADFKSKTVSYQLKEKDGEILAQKLDVATEASNLSSMIACSWWASKPQYIDNFELNASVEKPELPLKNKTIYAFGDSIVEGHAYTKAGFADFVSAGQGMNLTKYAKNGASIMNAGYPGGQVLTQLEEADAEAPDYVLFNGGTNDAEYIENNPDEITSFAGEFENTVATMKDKWPDAKCVYVAVHKLGSRDNEIQEKLHDLEMQVCDKWNIIVANLYEEASLDTNDVNQKNKYTFDRVGDNGLPSDNGSGTHPNFLAIEEFYVPIVSKTLRDIVDTPDTEVDKSALEALITSIESLDQKEYKQKSWNHLTEVLTLAKNVADNENAAQEAIDTAFLQLAGAFNKLERVLNTSAAEAMIQEAEAVLAEEDKYRPSDLENIEDALESLQNTIKAEETTQSQLDKQVLNLQSALMNVKEQVDPARLQKVVELAQEFLEDRDKYTTDTISNLEAAVEEAQTVLDDENRTQEQVGNAYTAVTDAIAKLQPAGDREVLASLIKRAELILSEPEKYTDQSIDGLAEALEEAQAVYENENALQKDVDEAARTLATELSEVRILGDVNHDGQVDTLDAADLLKVSAEIEEVDEYSSSAGDVNKDGVTDTGDAVKILKYAAEMLMEF